MKLKIIACFLSAFLYTAQSESATTFAKPYFSDEEVNAFRWFERIKIESKFRCSSLSLQDQAVLLNNVGLEESKIRQAYLNLTNAILERAPEKKYDSTFIVAIMDKLSNLPTHNFKPTDILSARWYVFKVLLSPEERTSILKDNYLNNPGAAYTMLAKAGRLFAQELAHLKLIEDTAEEKEKVAHEYTQERISILKHEFEQ
jgi:hypothetical protein